MQISPFYPPPPSIINRAQQVTPASSVAEEDTTLKLYRKRSVSNPHEDDYYFYHTGRGMTSRRSSIQSLGRRPEDDAKAPDQVRLPPITSLFAAVERASTKFDTNVLAPQPQPQPQPRQFAREPYYSPPTTYPHMPYRRQSIFSTYSSTSSPQVPSYGSHLHPPHSGSTPYRTPSPPYPQRHIPIPHTYPTTYIQPRPPPSLMPSRAPSTFALTHRTNSASPAERYMCHECNKSFSRPSSLRIHTFSHTGEKPFVCPEPGCTKRFSVRSNMRRHMKVHSETAPGEAARAESVKEDDRVSETSATSPGHRLPVRPRQGSRSSI